MVPINWLSNGPKLFNFERPYCLVRNIIQTGCLATAWALAALATWFLLPNKSVYRIFDMTSGTIYTHVSVSVSLFHLFRLNEVDIFQAMFETLLSRIRLRERMEASSSIHVNLQQVCQRRFVFLLTVLHMSSTLN